MSEYLDTIDSWPNGKPLPPKAITILFDPDTNKEYRIETARLGGNGGASTNYNKTVYTAKARGAQTITSADVPGLDTAALVVSVGVRGVDAQGTVTLDGVSSDNYFLSQGVLTIKTDADIDQDDVLEIDFLTAGQLAAAGLNATQLGQLLVAGSGISINPTPDGKLLITATVVAAPVAAPRAPTDGQVDDTADTFSFLPNPAYPAAAQYKVVGRPGVAGAEQLDATNSYTNGNRIVVKVVGAVARGGLAVYVAGSGSVPDGAALTNAEAFTGAVVSTPVATKATPPNFGAIDDINNVVTLSSQYAYTEVEWGVEGQGPQALASNSICSPGNIAGRLYARVLADPNATPPRLQSDTVYSQPFSLAATANNAPTATISVVGGTSSVAPGQSVTLQLDGADSDAGDSVTKLEALDNGVKIGEITGASGTLITPGLTAGSHSFTARATDTRGASGLSTAVSVVAQAAGTALLFSPQSSEFFPNLRNDTGSAGPGYVYRDAIGAWGIRTNTTSLLVRGKTSFPAQYLNVANLAVYVDSNFFQLLTFTQSGTEQEFSVTGLPAGSKFIQIYEGSPFRGGEQGFIQVINLTGVTVPTGFTATVEMPAKKNIGIVVLSNSRGVGGGVANGALYAWTRQLGRQMNADVYLIGYSSLQMGAHMSTAGQRQQIVTEAKTRLAGYATTYYIEADDENDHAYNTFTPAQLKSFRQSLIPQLRSELPNTKLVYQTVLPDRDGNNRANGNGYTHADYDAALKEAVAGQTNAYLLNIQQAGAAAADYFDDAHLGISGENKVTAFYLSKLPNLSAADQPVAVVTPPPPSGPGFHTVTSEDFDSSTQLPANYSTRAGYAVVASPTTLTGSNAVEVTAVQDLVGIGPTQTLTDGRFRVAGRVVPTVGTAYWGVRFAEQPDGSCYFISASSIAASTSAFYVWRQEGQTSSPALRKSENFTTVRNFYDVTIGRVGARVVATIRRTADNYYLNEQGVFAPGYADFWNADDPNPLPAVAGTSNFYCYLESSATGQALFDSAALESYS